MMIGWLCILGLAMVILIALKMAMIFAELISIIGIDLKKYIEKF